MKAQILLPAFSLFAAAVSAAPTAASSAPAVSSSEVPLPTEASSDPNTALDQLDVLASFAYNETTDAVDGGSTTKRGGCTLANLAIRREWGSLSSSDKKAYITAAKCLQAKTAKTPNSLVAGAKNRLDDFVATHINQTLTIHYTGTFLAWHRYFIYEYEQALRNECGYTGYQPYWNWGYSALTGLAKSPVWDGSDTSMSGNGAVVANQGNVILGGNGLPEIVLPHGTGGGCVTSGPFKDMTVNLGPVALNLADGLPGSVGNADPFAYNPRCLKRDLTDAINKRFANASSIVNLILGHDDIYDFQMTMQGYPGTGDIGVHGGGHYSMGGDPGRDLYTSPGDPAFYLHHGMIDRTWWIWQQLDKRNREGPNGISGTGTFLDSPPSANTTVNTPVELGYAGGDVVKMGDLLSTTAGPFCYIYL